MTFLMLAVFDPGGTLMVSIINMLISIGKMLLNMLIRMVPNLVGIIANLIPVIIEAIAKAVSALANAAPVIIQGLTKALDVLIQKLPSLLDAIIEGVLTLLPVLIGALIELLPKVLKLFLLYAIKFITFIGRALPKIIEGLAELIPVLLTTLADGLPGIITALIGAVPKIITALVRALPKVITALVGSAAAIITALVQAIPALVKAIADMFQDPKQRKELALAFSVLMSSLFVEIPNILVNALGDLGGAIDEALGINFFRDFFTWLGKVLTFVNRLFGAIMTFDLGFLLSFLSDSLLDLIVKPLWGLFLSVLGMLVDGWLWVFDKYVDLIMFLWGRLFEYLQLPVTTVYGITKTLFKKIWKWLKGWGKTLPWLGKLLKELESASQSLGKWLSDLWDKFRTFFTIDNLIAEAKRKIENFFKDFPALKGLTDLFLSFVRKVKNAVAGLPFMGGVEVVGTARLTDVFTGRNNAKEVDVLTRLARGKASAGQAASELGLARDTQTITALEKLTEGLKKLYKDKSSDEIARALRGQSEVTGKMADALKSLQSQNVGKIRIDSKTFKEDS